jgi:hypothetical protein
VNSSSVFFDCVIIIFCLKVQYNLKIKYTKNIKQKKNLEIIKICWWRIIHPVDIFFSIFTTKLSLNIYKIKIKKCKIYKKYKKYCKFLQNPPFQRWKVAETRQGRFRRYLRSYPQWPLPATFPGRRRTRGSSHLLSIPSVHSSTSGGPAVLPLHTSQADG